MGEWRLNLIVSATGRVEVYLVHRPQRGSSFGASLKAKDHLICTDQELLDGDWPNMLVRAAYKVSGI